MFNFRTFLANHRANELTRYWERHYEARVLKRTPEALQTDALRQELTDFYRGVTGYIVGHKQTTAQLAKLHSTAAMQHFFGEEATAAPQEIRALKLTTRHITRNLDAYVHETSRALAAILGEDQARSLIGRTVQTAIRAVDKVHHRRYHIDPRGFTERLTQSQSATGFLGV